MPAWTGACPWGKNLQSAVRMASAGLTLQKVLGSDCRHTAQPSWASCAQLPRSSRAPRALSAWWLFGVFLVRPCCLMPQAPRASWTPLQKCGAADQGSCVLMLTGLRQRLSRLRVKCWRPSPGGETATAACAAAAGVMHLPRRPPGPRACEVTHSLHGVLRAPRSSHTHSMGSSQSPGHRDGTHSTSVLWAPRVRTLTPRRPPGPWALEWPSAQPGPSPGPSPRGPLGYHPQATFLRHLALLLDGSPCLICRAGSVCV